MRCCNRFQLLPYARNVLLFAQSSYSILPAVRPNLKSNALRPFGEISRSWVHRELLSHLALKGQIRYKSPSFHKSHIFGVLLAMKQPIAKNSAGFLGTRHIIKVKRSNGVGASLHIELFGGRQSPYHRPLHELFDRIGGSRKADSFGGHPIIACLICTIS